MVVLLFRSNKRVAPCSRTDLVPLVYTITPTEWTKVLQAAAPAASSPEQKRNRAPFLLILQLPYVSPCPTTLSYVGFFLRLAWLVLPLHGIFLHVRILLTQSLVPYYLPREIPPFYAQGPCLHSAFKLSSVRLYSDIVLPTRDTTSNRDRPRRPFTRRVRPQGRKMAMHDGTRT